MVKLNPKPLFCKQWAETLDEPPKIKFVCVLHAYSVAVAHCQR